MNICTDYQAAGRAYGERLISEQFLNVINSCNDESLRPVLLQLHRLYVLDILENDLGWYMLSGILSADLAHGVSVCIAQTCKELAPNSLALTEAFGMSDAMLSAPIALDWITYNERDNQGEVRK